MEFKLQYNIKGNNALPQNVSASESLNLTRNINILCI